MTKFSKPENLASVNRLDLMRIDLMIDVNSIKSTYFEFVSGKN